MPGSYRHDAIKVLASRADRGNRPWMPFSAYDHGRVKPGVERGVRVGQQSVKVKFMKKNLLMTGIVVSLAITAICPAAADGYRHDDNGYWDGNNHHHRGYWDQRGSARVFISL
jgi:hypothetical protein